MNRPTGSEPESKEARRSRVAWILRALKESRPEPRVELHHRDALQLLIATILSAQSTDARVNLVTPALFSRYPDAAALADADPEELMAAIRSTGFFRSKARAIQGCCRTLVEKHGGQVPQTMDELVALPGVGRKTANVVLGAGYGIASGIVVDTHMTRLARRLRLTRQGDPVKIERDLLALVPREDWIFFSHAGVLHGRYVCQARLPLCGNCALEAYCPSRLIGAKPRPSGGVKRRPKGSPVHPRRSRDRS